MPHMLLRLHKAVKGKIPFAIISYYHDPILRVPSSKEAVDVYTVLPTSNVRNHNNKKILLLLFWQLFYFNIIIFFF